jgi:hypothetical protein
MSQSKEALGNIVAAIGGMGIAFNYQQRKWKMFLFHRIIRESQ